MALRVLLALGVLVLAAVGVLLVIAGLSIDEAGWAAVYIAVGVVLLGAAVLGARPLWRGDIQAAGWVLGLAVPGTLSALLGSFYAFVEAVCEGGDDCTYVSDTVEAILIFGGLGLVAAAIAVGLRRVR